MYRVGGALEAALHNKWGKTLISQVQNLESASVLGGVA
jgi:hypothetical protein